MSIEQENELADLKKEFDRIEAEKAAANKSNSGAMKKPEKNEPTLKASFGDILKRKLAENNKA